MDFGASYFFTASLVEILERVKRNKIRFYCLGYCDDDEILRDFLVVKIAFNTRLELRIRVFFSHKAKSSKRKNNERRIADAFNPLTNLRLRDSQNFSNSIEIFSNRIWKDRNEFTIELSWKLIKKSFNKTTIVTDA